MPVKQEVLDRVVGSVTEIVKLGGEVNPKSIENNYSDLLDNQLFETVAHFGNIAAPIIKSGESNAGVVRGLRKIFKGETESTSDDLLNDFEGTLARVLYALADRPEDVKSAEEAKKHLKKENALPTKFKYSDPLIRKAMALADALPKE